MKTETIKLEELETETKTCGLRHSVARLMVERHFVDYALRH
jgi:hypothetical protein